MHSDMDSDTDESATAEELTRLKAAFESRRQAPRKLSHSVAVAYRQLIAAYEREITAHRPTGNPKG